MPGCLVPRAPWLRTDHYRGGVRRPVIDGDSWIAERLAFLHGLLLEESLSPEQRQIIESEIEVLSMERGVNCGGTRSPRRMGRRARKKGPSTD
jgi:hypothetical protein